MRTRITPVLLALAVASSSLPALAAQRVFVASYGNDANPGCTLSAPCRGFQAAHDAVDPSGEVVALDAAGYGPVTITKSVTLMANPGVIAAIAVSSGNGITIATAGVDVILRGININDVGTGANGIHMTDGSSLSIENCLVSNFGAGVRVEAGARVKVVNSVMRGNGTGMQAGGGASVDVVGSQFLGNTGGFGFTLQGLTASTTDASITDSVSSGNFSGYVATASAAGAVVRLSCTRCTASNNDQVGFIAFGSAGGTSEVLVSGSQASYNGQYGFLQGASGGTATFQSLGNNALQGNLVSNTGGTIATIAGF